jgi:hypothetical protein
MNATLEAVKPKRSHHKKKPGPLVKVKPNLPPLDPVAAAIEAARHAQEGNTRLARAIDCLRECLQIIVVAEVDNQTKLPVTARDLRALAAEGLDAYSALTGQDWRSPRNRVVRTRAGRAEGPNSRGRNVGNDGEDYD